MRIASLQPSISIVLESLGRLDTLCACTRYCIDAIPALAHAGIPVLNDSWSFDKPTSDRQSDNLSQLLGAKPDLVIASVPYRPESLGAILKTGLPILTLAPHTLADIATDIRLIASITNSLSMGESLIAQMHAALEDARIATERAQRPFVYCEEWGKPLIHSQSWVAELVEAAGGNFLGTPGSHTTAEEVAAADPHVLLFAWCGAGNRVPLARVIEQRNWRHLSAVRNARVFCIPDQYLNTPAPSLVQGLACIAAATHPNLFPQRPEIIRLEENQLRALTTNPSHSTL
jgi:iron complex transport system substrate-binding protein